MSDSLETLIKHIATHLKTRGEKVVTAESCTGGGLAYSLTKRSGSSDWFERGFVTYSDQAKIDLLGVLEKTLAKYGAVSTETAAEMADGALKNSQSQWSIAITGIAGPTGGTSLKPVGTVWFGLAGHNQKTVVFPFLFTGNRRNIREQSIYTALDLFCDFIIP